MEYDGTDVEQRAVFDLPAGYRAAPGGPLDVDRSFYDRIASAPRRQLRIEFEIPARSGVAWEVPAGCVVRLNTVEGPQVGDLNMWNRHNPRERFWAARTRQLQRSSVTTYDRLWSTLPFLRPMATITADTLGDHPHSRAIHDLLGSRCDPYVNRMLTGEDFDYHCHSNLVRAVQPYGLTEFDVHDVLNVFQFAGLNRQGEYFFGECPALPGDYFEFFAEIDLLVAMSTCPGGDLALPMWGAEAAPIQAQLEHCHPVGVQVFEVDPALLTGWKQPAVSSYAGRHGRHALSPVAFADPGGRTRARTMGMRTTTRSAMAERINRISRRPAALGTTSGNAVSLAMSEPRVGAPTVAVAAATAALKSGRTGYAPMGGAPVLRAAVAVDVSSSRRTVTPDEVVLTHGGSAGLAATILSLVGPGDRVVVPEPTYSLYSDQVAAAGGEVVWVPNRPDGGPDLDRITNALPGSRMVIMCHPGNPTGYVLTPAELTELGSLARRHEAWLLCDEAYREIVFDDVPYFSCLDLPQPDNVICCGTFSKGYAMTGWRLGWIVAAAPVADQISTVHRTFNGPLNTFVQEAAVAALSEPKTSRRLQLLAYQEQRDAVVEALSAIPCVSLSRPAGAFYAFPRIDLPMSATELTRRLSRAGVLVRAGSEFGPSGEGHIRVSFAADAQTVRTGLSRMTDCLSGLAREAGVHR